MAERLTEFNKTGWVLKLDEPQNEFEARQQLMSKFKFACEKLGKIEDMLEKYGIESLDTLEHIIKKGQVITSTIEGFANEVYDEMEQDRDTWKKACEFACDVLRDINYKIYNEDRIDFENTFYQQAKKEGDDE